jgi:SAM-dependent methyltransferase
MLGATAGYYESRWLLLEGSRQLDVFDLGEGIGRRTRERLEEHGLAERCDFIHADLNFTALPREQYDVVFAVSTLHHLVRLEHAFSEIARALRPGGLFAFYEYVGPRRVQFDDSTLGRSAEVLATIPEKYVRADVTNVPETDLSPFEAYRSDEIVPLARAAFEELWFADSVVFTSLYFRLDLPTLERERPDIIERLVGLEREASRDGVPGSTAYAVYQKR